MNGVGSPPVVAGNSMQNTSSNTVRKETIKYVTELDETKTKVIERYLVGKQLGKGGFATVYELISEKTGKKYAGKIVDKNLLLRPKVRDKFMSEIRIHQSLNHRHICKMYKHFEDNRYHYLILELCSNRTLSHLVKNRKYLTEPEVQYFLLQLIDAVQYLHSHSIIHRDLKLGNVFLDENLEVKVGDLGLAAQLSDPSERKKTMCGTPNYIAPEILQSSSHRAYSYEVDIWAVGVMTYTMLIGKAPFDGGNVKTTYQKIQENEYSFPVNERHISHQARMFIRSILTKDPGSRLTLEQMKEHPFFTDSPISPPKSLPLSILRQPYLLTAQIPSLPTPVLQRTREMPSLTTNTSEDVTKRVKMTEIAKNILSRPVPRLDTKLIPGGSSTSKKLYINTDYDYDGNGKNNLNRFSLTSIRSKGMEDRIDYLNRSFHDQRGLLPQETFEGLPAGTVPSITVVRNRYQEKEGASLLLAHAANLHTAMHHPSLVKSADHTITTRTANWIVDEYDFTKKYGIGYMFSNGNIGILFNDKSSIVVSADGLYYEYHPRISIMQWNFKQTFPPSNSGHIDNYPIELSKKITLIKYFRANFLERTQSRQLTKEEIEDTARRGPTQNMPFVLKWLIKEGGSICMLSTGAILVRYDGGTILNLESPFDDITFLDKFGIVSAMPLAKAITLGRDDINRRLEFITNNITDIVTKLSRNSK